MIHLLVSYTVTQYGTMFKRKCPVRRLYAIFAAYYADNVAFAENKAYNIRMRCGE